MKLNESKFLEDYSQYLSLEKKYSDNTIKAYLNDLLEFQLFLNLDFEKITIKETTYPIIRLYIMSKFNSGTNSNTVNRKIASLKNYFNYLIKSEQLDLSPMQNHKSIKGIKTKQIPFSQDEIKDLFKNLPPEINFITTRNRLILEFLYATGIRRAELINLEIKNVDLSRMIIKVIGKRNKERSIPIVSSLKELVIKYYNLRTQIKESSCSSYFFITKKASKINASLVYRLTNKYLNFSTEKLKKSPHMFRHTFATHLINNGAGINEVKELLGHSSLASTQVYTQANMAELQKTYLKAHPRNK